MPGKLPSKPQPKQDSALNGCEHPRQTAPVHALYRRCRSIPKNLRGNRRRGLQGISFLSQIRRVRPPPCGVNTPAWGQAETNIENDGNSEVTQKYKRTAKVKEVAEWTDSRSGSVSQSVSHTFSITVKANAEASLVGGGRQLRKLR